jgi:hypothetical protein
MKLNSNWTKYLLISRGSRHENALHRASRHIVQYRIHVSMGLGRTQPAPPLRHDAGFVFSGWTLALGIALMAVGGTLA